VFIPGSFFVLIDSNSKQIDPLLFKADKKGIISLTTRASLLPYGNIKVVLGVNKRYNLNHTAY